MLISYSVAKGFRDRFAMEADSLEPLMYSAGYDQIPIDVHVPVLDIPNLPVKPLPRSLEKAVIQGTFTAERRNYQGIFRGLTSASVLHISDLAQEIRFLQAFVS